MLYHILAVGDVVMEPGLRHLERHLRPLQKWKIGRIFLSRL